LGQGFGGDLFGFSQLLLVEAFCMGAVSRGKVGRLDKSPAEILVAIFAIALVFLFIVGEMKKLLLTFLLVNKKEIR
jgi:hypothetical protein